MSTENDVARSLGSWLNENRHEDANRVLDLVLDQIPTTPQRRAGWLARRFPTLSTYARYGLVAAAVVLAVAVGIGLYTRSGVGSPPASTSPSPSASTSDPIAGLWAAPVTTCEQQNATIDAAGFTAEQVRLSGWSCPNGGTNQYSVRFRTTFGPSVMTITDGSAQAGENEYRIVDDQTFEAFYSDGPFCQAFGYVIVGDTLTISKSDHGCSVSGDQQPLNDQVALTAILETSPFTRQP